MAYSALEPLSAGLFAKLNVASLKTGITGLTVTVKDHVPQPLPVSASTALVLYVLREKDISGLGSGPSVKQIQLRLHVFSMAETMKQAQQIMAVAIGLLQFVEPTATGWQIPAIGRPNDVIPIETSEINGVICRELVSIWDDFFACENAA